MSQATNQKQEAVSCIASAFGISEIEVTDNMMLGCWAHYIAWTIFFRTGQFIKVSDLGKATVGDILEQIQ